MELRHLRYFVTVADELNFTRAATLLHTAQPSLSQQIRDLESEVGVQLLERSNRKVELTEAGKVFLSEARLTLAQADRAVARARHVVQQGDRTVTIGFVPAAEARVFPSILPKLRMRFPQLNVELRSLPTLEQEDALLRDDIDVAFMREPVHSAELDSEVVLTEELVVLLPAAHPLAKLERIPLEKLDGEAFISSDPQFSGKLYNVVEDYFATHGLRRSVVQVATNILLNLNLVGMGLGYALLPAYVSSLAGEAICCRPLDCEPPSIDLLMVYRADNRSASLENLLELVRSTAITR
ncbi:LysR family hca operon transcriptional activator [Paraburkholderia eburnea]|uniref:LysR family hca operon transcriptional activator n=1 Tax=Paraburkholderia eburnea TaxID=1189126 RepID=A0A2S4M646_9BURK|nr:DNA-binding transcriptional regulator HcaR [Paraburkholderia eburnea]POR50174.1 LysR family hca operon transcriptional activator [Paraburkholderia eburnea]PRZ20545.1 LysR family hca operon transcriptional activator [Paraburkholderia eburnea]